MPRMWRGRARPARQQRPRTRQPLTPPHPPGDGCGRSRPRQPRHSRHVPKDLAVGSETARERVRLAARRQSVPSRPAVARTVHPRNHAAAAVPLKVSAPPLRSAGKNALARPRAETPSRKKCNGRRNARGMILAVPWPESHAARDARQLGRYPEMLQRDPRWHRRHRGIKQSRRM